MKKALPFVSIAVSMLLLLGACSTPAATTAPPASTQAPASADAQTQAPTEPDALDTSAPQDIEVMAYFVANVDPGDAILQVLDKKFNVTIKPTITKIDDYASTLSMRISAGDVPDWFRVTDDTLFGQLVEDSQIINISDYVDKYGFANIKKQFDLPQAYQLAMATGGKFYRSPDSLGHLNPNYYIRGDWLEKLGLKMPTTYQEFKTVLKAFVDNDPDGKGAVGLTTYGDWSMSSFASDWVGYNNWGKVNGELTWAWVDPAIKDDYKYWASLYKEGLLDPEIYSNSYEVAMQKFASGRSGALIMNMIQLWWDNNEKPLLTYKADAKLRAIVPPPAGPAGSTFAMGTPYYADSVFSAKAEEAKKIRMLMVMDYLLSDEGRELTLYGIEGQHYDLVDGKKVQRTEAVMKEWGQGQHFLGEIADFGSNDIMTTTQDVKDWFAWQDQPGSAMPDPVGRFSTEETTRILANISEVRNKYHAKFYTGEMDIDANWDAYVAEIKAAGYDDLKAIYADYFTKNNVKLTEVTR